MAERENHRPRQQHPVIYEVNLEVAPRIAGEFDAWLSDHVRELLRLDGFESARIQADEERAEDRWLRRTVSYRLRDRAALEAYLTRHAEHMRRDGRERFGDNMRARRRIFELGGEASALGCCENCGTVLHDMHCRRCGQRREARLMSLGRLARELIDGLFSADSRIWRTLRDLLFHPGRLSRTYLDGRRVHYTPPFRLYILISLAFFLSLPIGGGTGMTGMPFGSAVETSADPDERRLQITRGVERCMEMDVRLDPGGFIPVSTERLAWVEEKIRMVCIQGATNPRQLWRQALGNLSSALFILLPLMAGMMKVLYLFSRQLFVVHLLFLSHFQAFVFLNLLLVRMLARSAEMLDLSGLAPLAWTAGILWIFGWLAIGMRRVYGQARWLTGLKFIALAIAYFVALVLAFIGLATWTMLSF
jgi:hypothetical protein